MHINLSFQLTLYAFVTVQNVLMVSSLKENTYNYDMRNLVIFHDLLKKKKIDEVKLFSHLSKTDNSSDSNLNGKWSS